MRAVGILFRKQGQFLTRPIVRSKVVIAESEEVQRIRRHRLVRINLHDLLEAVCRGQIGLPPVVKLPDKEVHLSQQIMAFLNPVDRLAVVPAARIVSSQPFEGINGFLNGFRVAINALRTLHVAFADPETGVGSEHVTAMQIEEVVILDDGFGEFFLFEERFSAFHNDVWIVVLFNRIAEEDRFVRSTQSFLGRGIAVLWRARAGHEQAEGRHP